MNAVEVTLALPDRLTAQAMTQPDVYRMIRRRAVAACGASAGVATRIGCHSWRVRGLAACPENRGLLEHAEAMAGHAGAPPAAA